MTTELLNVNCAEHREHERRDVVLCVVVRFV